MWNYYRDKINDDPNQNNAANNRLNNNKTIASKSFEYHTKLVGSTSDDNNILDVEVHVPLTLPGLGFFESLTVGEEGGVWGRLVGPQ